ncbi:pitrilysin family protein [Carboxydocella sp. JDF658]|uniref:M16 family metallopeptidase n=1 Tax=Carboxydocella sp. JDF658 TaxID=1926600 RepID=UPI0009ACBD49|nr:pitrilysin family protein [Carboxydocella sp. JDF658]GAW30727.1 peptidase M16 [Carboxydocella sp. JDF658]
MIEKIVLPNGVRIVYEHLPWVKSVSIGIWVKAGSVSENEQNNGISHFIEHMMFKGTTQRSAKALAEALDAVGGQLNAFTSKEYTCYYAKVLDEYIDIAIDVLTDMFFNSLFATDAIDKERNVILEEIKMYEDTPDDIVHDLLSRALFSGHALGRPIIGTTEIINNIRREDILTYLEQTYRPENTVIAIAGSFEPEYVKNRFTQLFVNWQRENALTITSQNTFEQQPVLVKTKDIEQVHICLGSYGLAAGDPDIYGLHCLNSLLGGGISSRLFQSIREERGLAYSVYSYTSNYMDTGILGIYAGLTMNNIPQVLTLIKENFEQMLNDLNEEELHRTKQQIKGNFVLGLESASSRMSRLGKLELTLGRITPIEEVLAKIDQVTVEQVKQLGTKFWYQQGWSLAAIGPKGTQEVIESWHK